MAKKIKQIFFSACLGLFPPFQGVFYISINQNSLRDNIPFSFFFAVRYAGFQFSDQGLNLCPLQWECGVLTTGPPGKSLDHQALVRKHQLSKYFVCQCQGHFLPVLGLSCLSMSGLHISVLSFLLGGCTGKMSGKH